MRVEDYLPLHENSVHAISVASRTADLAEEARQQGCELSADRLESCFIDLLTAMPKRERAAALMRSYDNLMKYAPPETPETPELRLVHSSDWT